MSRSARTHRAVAAALLITFAGAASGCFSIHVAAPPLPARVRVLPADAPAEVSIKYQTFYYAWGLFPMTRSDRVQYIVEQERLVEARVIQGGQTQGIIAGLLGTFALGGFILPQNLTIEGNRTPTLGPLSDDAR
jgi:hypothetical protein